MERLQIWNKLPAEEALLPLLSCCASKQWAEAVVKGRPYSDLASLEEAATKIWWTMQEEDWMAAFAAHPRIGESKAHNAPAQSKAWSSQEQSFMEQSEEAIRQAIAIGNLEYEERFGFIYLVCASGKSATELLTILQRRLARDRATELREAAEQQRQITTLRLRKWLEA
jgi:OHCU decarboxylase